MSDVVRDHFVYRVFDAASQLLYIGCTKRLDKRWVEHQSERPQMVARAATFKLQGPFPRAVARQMELHALRSEEPVYGWTPERGREARRINKWISNRAMTLHQTGVEMISAVYQAVAEADEIFPSPYIERQRASS